MRPYHDWSDQQIIDEIGEYRAAKKKVAMGQVAVIAGEGRRIEYTPSQIKLINAELRELADEARERNLPIGGDAGGAIAVEFG